MFKKCKANCLASKYLWIRNNNIFYFIIELDKSNNKRKYFDRSLHTNNYYEAKSLMNSLIFEEYDEEIDSGDQIFLRKVKRLSSLNDIKTVP